MQIQVGHVELEDCTREPEEANLKVAAELLSLNPLYTTEERDFRSSKIPFTALF